MKVRLLTLAALGWAASAMAGDWEAPTYPKINYTPTEVSDIEAGGEYYIYNSAAAQFLTGANAWGTQASVDTVGITFIMDELSSSLDDSVKGWGMKNQRNDKKNKYVFFDGGGDSFIDMGNQNNTYPDCNLWNIVKQADGTYTIQITEGCSLYADGAYFAWVSNVDGNSTIVKPGVDPELDAETYGEIGIYWQFLTVEQYEADRETYIAAIKTWEAEYALYQAKVALYEKLNEAEDNDVATDAAEAVYNNPDATIEELNEATDALAGAIAMLEIGDQLDGASEDNPVDATFLFKNNDFEAGNANGWDFWAENVSNKGYQGANYKNGDVQISKFIELWKSGNEGMKNGYIQQKAAYLPAGHYVLEADAIACNQGYSNPADIHGVQLFITVGEETYSCEVATDNGKPQHFELDVEVGRPGAATFGMRFVDTDANWVAADNFQMTYFGIVENLDLLKMNNQLKAMQKVGDEAYDEDDNYLYSAATIEAYEALIKEAEKLTAKSSAEEINAMIEQLVAMTEKVTAEKKAYVELRKLYKQIVKDATTYAEMEVVGEELGALMEDIEEKLDNGTASLEDIEKFQADYKYLMEVEAPKHIEEGTDLTFMLKNPNFDDNVTDGWTWTNGGAGNFGASAAEVYDREFNVYQELTGLPNGLYEVSLQGFCRQGSVENASSLYNSGDKDVAAYIYGTTGGMTLKTPFKNIFDGRDSEQHYEEGVTDVSHLNNPWGGSDRLVTIEDEPCYVPDGMAGFGIWEEWDPERYRTFVQLVVTDGTLRIGAACDNKRNGGFWCIFDTFTLTYVSKDAGNVVKDAMVEEVERLNNHLDELCENQALPVDICEAVAALVEEVETTTDFEAFAAKVESIKNQLDAVAAEALAIFDRFNYYTTMADEIDSSDPENFAGLMDEMYEKFDPGQTWENVEAMRADAEALSKGWFTFVASDALASASVDSPADVSEVILNRGFYYDNGDSHACWDITMDGGANAASWNEQEFYNNNSFDINQTLYGLKEGYYTVQAKGFHRPGWPLNEAVLPADTVFEHHADLYATVGETTWSNRLMTIYEGAAKEALGFGGEFVSYANDEDKAAEVGSYYYPNSMECAQSYFMYDPEDTGEENVGYYRGNKVTFEVKNGEVAVVGIKKDNHTEGDWTIFDNFQLFYLGTEAPDAVSSAVAGASVKQAYYTIGGVQVARPQRGVNIIVTTLSDGSVVKSKVLVK